MIDKSNENSAQTVNFESVEDTSKKDGASQKSFTDSLNETYPNTAINKRQLGSMWDFLMMGNQKSNVPLLEELCKDLIQLMTQKTAGQRKDKKEDLSFDNISTVLCGIVIESMALYLSGDLEKLEVKEDGVQSK